MADGLTDLLPAGDLAGDPAGDPAGAPASRARIEALIAAARELSDSCADLADELRPDGGQDEQSLRADQAAALLDEAASVVRETLGLLGAASASLGEDVPAAGPAAVDDGAIGDEVRGDQGEEIRVGQDDVLPAPPPMPTTWPDAFREAAPRSVPEAREAPDDDLAAATAMDLYGGTEIGADLDHDRSATLAAVPAALAGWVVVDPDDDPGGEPVALEHRPTGPLPLIDPADPIDPIDPIGPIDPMDPADLSDPAPEAADTPAAAFAAAAPGPTMLTVSTDEEPYADDPYGEPASTEPRSLTLVPPLPPGDPETHQEPVTALPPPADPPETPTEPQHGAASALADLAPAAAGSWVPDTGAPWTPAEVPDPWSGRSVWAVDPVPGSSAAGDGLPVYPLDDPDQPELPPTPAEAALPPEPIDDPGAAVVARQVEAARRHLQAALVMANKDPKLGALLTAVEQALTSVTDLARETRGVLPECLADRTFPGEARFLCSNPWETVALVGREAYGDEPTSPAGLAKLLRALGYDAESVTSASGVSGVQIRSERYAAHVALVEPAGGGRQRWSGALEWTDRSGASRTWAETLGPVELSEDELARRVDELLRRSVGS